MKNIRKIMKILFGDLLSVLSSLTIIICSVFSVIMFINNDNEQFTSNCHYKIIMLSVAVILGVLLMVFNAKDYFRNKKRAKIIRSAAESDKPKIPPEI